MFRVLKVSGFRVWGFRIVGFLGFWLGGSGVHG